MEPENSQPEENTSPQLEEKKENSLEKSQGESGSQGGEIHKEGSVGLGDNASAKDQSSIENMMISGVNNVSDIKPRQPWWSMKDFNNVIEADRKLVINKSNEFWVHDDVLSFYSDFFADLLSKPEQLQVTGEEARTELEMPQGAKFFDILFWMYSRDTKKLKKASKNFHDFLKLISIGIFLKMKPDFFEILLNKLPFQWKEEFFYDSLWSRKIFTYPVLERVVDEMKTNNFTKTVGKKDYKAYSYSYIR